MISTADFRNGLVVILDDVLWELVEFQHVKPGKGSAFVRTKLRNVLTGRSLERTFRSGERMEDARLTTEIFQYLYHDGDLYHFMNNETYDQIAVGEDVIGDNKNWMKENDNVSLLFHNGKVISSEVPMNVTLTITKSDPGIQGDRSSGGTKPATLETGVTVQVPLFLNEGDVIKVNTSTAQYLERVSS